MNRLMLSVLMITAACSEYEPRTEDLGPLVDNPPVEEPLVQVDRTLCVPQPQVDILFVVDNSCSMSEEQAALGENFPGFMEYFTGSGLDYHIGVVSTDMESSTERGRLRRINGHNYIDQESENPILLFQAMANMGTNCAIDEMGRAAAYATLELNATLPRNEGFARPDAALHMVFISDEEDQSTNNPSNNEFLEWMANHKESPDLVTAHAIVGKPGEVCDAIDSVGTRYLGYASATGGIGFSLCEPDWAPLLDELGLQTSGLRQEYFLSRIPELDPLGLEVEVHYVNDAGVLVKLEFDVCLADDVGVDPSCEVQYNGGRNSITFLEFVPEPQAEVIVTYTLR